MKKRLLLILLAVAVIGVVVVMLRPRVEVLRDPTIPTLFAPSLAKGCTQVLLVLAPDDHSVTAKLWLMQRDAEHDWQKFDGPFDVTLGHQGLAWGTGEHAVPAPAGFRIKHEGDKCSPAGVFRIPFTFDMAPGAAGLQLPYTPLTPNIIGVDDPKSRYYNQVVDSTKVTRDWDSNEAMMRHDRLYAWGAFVSNNPTNTPGNGSCIFLHIWPGPGQGTAGCTAMSEADLKVVLAWLDPKREPRLVQGIEGW
jgi:L,D-peptidoglycan transpeptidase YkuD (ErfK/YbiS/YcfS/YnhG family)